MKDYELSNRRYVIGGVATFIVVVYIIRLFTLQIMSDDYKKNADSNAFLKRIDYPSRGIITDRKGRLMVYNQPAYDILVVMNEARGRLDTMEFCRTVGMTKEEFVARMDAIKDRSKNPGYSRFTQQLFMGQIPDKEFSQFREKIFRFPGFYIQKRSVRQYEYPYAAHVIGDVEGKVAIVVDDMIDTAGTLCAGAEVLLKYGASRIIACATHPVLSGPAIERINNTAALDRVIVTDTIPLGDKLAACPKLEVVSVAALLGKTIHNIHTGSSVSVLFV